MTVLWILVFIMTDWSAVPRYVDLVGRIACCSIAAPDVEVEGAAFT